VTILPIYWYYTAFNMPLFSKSPTAKEQVRATEKVVRTTQRTLERERNDLDRQEKKLQNDIKTAAKQGNKQTCTILAKQLLQLRKQKTKTYQVGSRVQSIGTQAKVMHSNMKMADAMATTTKTMVDMNKVMDPMKTAQTMKQFEMESAKMEMTEEMMNDTLDDVLCDSGDEEEEDAIVNQVLDEIGIEISGKMSHAPAAHSGRLGETSKASTSDADIERQLAALKDL